MTHTNAEVDALINALVGPDPDRRVLYQTSPSYRHAVTQLAAMLPAMVDGIAAEAATVDADLEQAVALARQVIPVDIARTLGITFDDEGGFTVPRGPFRPHQPEE